MRKNKMDIINACPFCKNKNQKQLEIHQDIYHDGPHCLVICHMCGARGPAEWTKEAALKLWNNSAIRNK